MTFLSFSHPYGNPNISTFFLLQKWANNKEICGWWLVRDKLEQDLAALNRVEMLCWDAWA